MFYGYLHKILPTFTELMICEFPKTRFSVSEIAVNRWQSWYGKYARNVVISRSSSNLGVQRTYSFSLI